MILLFFYLALFDKFKSREYTNKYGGSTAIQHKIYTNLTYNIKSAIMVLFI